MYDLAAAIVPPVTDDDDDESDVSGSSLIYAPDSDSADEDGVVQFDSDESVVDSKSNTDESDIQDRERHYLISEWLIRNDENHMKRIRTLYYECRWKNQEWPHTDVLSIQGLASVLRHYIEPEESVPLAEGVRVLAIPTPAGLGNTAPKHAYRGTVKKILTRESSKEQIIEILFDVGVKGLVAEFNVKLRIDTRISDFYVKLRLTRFNAYRLDRNQKYVKNTYLEVRRRSTNT